LQFRTMLTIIELWVGKSGGRQAWVPASYFKDLSPIPPTVGGSIVRASQDTQEREVRKNEEKPTMSSEIDDFSRAFHDAIAQREETPQCDTHTPSGVLPGGIRAGGNGMGVGEVKHKKPRYQLVDGVVEETAKSPTKLERAQKRPSMPKLLAIEKTMSEEQSVSLHSAQADPRPATPPQLNRRFSWESEAKEESIPTAPSQTGSKFVPLPPIKILNRESSWSSDDTATTPDLIRSSTSSSSSSYTSISSTSTRSMLKFDPVMKKLFIVGNDPTSPLSESQSLDEYLESLSARMLDRQNKRVLPKTMPSTFKIEVKRENEDKVPTASVGAKGAAGSAPKTKSLQGSETAKEVPLLRPTDIFLRMMEEEERELKKRPLLHDHAPSEEAESMLNRRHPLREKRRRRRSKMNAESVSKLNDKREEMLFTENIESLGREGDLRISIAV
jgi:hypothetical protein